MQKLYGLAGKKKRYAGFSGSLEGVRKSTPRGVGLLEVGMTHSSLGNLHSVTSMRFNPYLKAAKGAVSWSDLVEAADFICFDLHIPRYLWVEACSKIGRNAAAACIVIIDQRLYDPTNPIESPRAYFKGMLKNADDHKLHLHRSIFGILEPLSQGTKEN